ncbi:S41 family peptidase [Phragmitibacter flavus]|nr:S41 family peptidase [Phragmitibacter flavus]
MTRLNGICCRIWLLMMGLTSANRLQAEEGNPVDGLSQNAVQSAFQLLRRDYIRREDLTFEELNRAALQGLLERLDFGADLVSVDEVEEKVKSGVHAEFLAPGVAYLRPESFGEGEGEMFAAALKDVVGKSATRLIVDLRAGGVGLFEEAALMLQCFVPEGEVMFKLRQLGEGEAELFVSRGAPLWEGEVVILMDRATGNAAETLAAALHEHGRVLLIGEKTQGSTVRYTELPLDEKMNLRYASAEMLLPSDGSIFKKGLVPNFELKMHRGEVERIIEKSRGKSMKPFVMDQVRPRYNEAALVHGGNPELDDYVQKSSGKKLPSDEPPLRDEVLQRALDLLTVETIVASAKIKWNEAEERTDTTSVKTDNEAQPDQRDKP